MHRLGWSHQKPRKRALERDEAAIRRFVSTGVAAAKKNAARLGAHLVFADESGFLLTPTLAKTWAPVGRTPVVRHLDRRDRISAISAISLSPLRQRPNLYFQLHHKNIQQAEVRCFLRHLLRHLRGHVFLFWDGGGPQKAQLVREFCRRVHRLHLVRLPAYAPEFNPDEGVWKLAKAALANGCPSDIFELEAWVTIFSLSRIPKQTLRPSSSKIE